MAIFFNSVKPYSPSEHIGSNASKQFEIDLRRHSLFLKGQSEERRKSSIVQPILGALAERRKSVFSQRRESVIAWKNSPGGRKASTSSTASSIGEEFDEKSQGQVWNSLFSPVFCFDPDVLPYKIQIPTLHVIGSKDQFQDYSKELIKFCDPAQMEVDILDIGHDIPRSGDGLKKIAQAFELITMMASFGGS